MTNGTNGTPVRENGAAKRTPARTFQLQISQRIERPRDDVFAFFTEPRRLEQISPPWLRLKMLGPCQEPVGEGTEFDYRLHLRGVPIRWRSLITSWRPPHGFADEQVRGPYRRWQHSHSFHPLADGATMVVDYVEYEVPGGRLLEGLVERFFVRPDIQRIFDWRRRRVAELLGA